MKQGKTLAGLGRELERQRNARKDFVADTRSLAMAICANRHIGRCQARFWRR